MPDPTLTNLAAEYRRNTESWKQTADFYSQAHFGTTTLHARNLSQRFAADWTALADLAEFGAMAAPHWEDAEARLVTAVRRLAAHLETPDA